MEVLVVEDEVDLLAQLAVNFTDHSLNAGVGVIAHRDRIDQGLFGQGSHRRFYGGTLLVGTRFKLPVQEGGKAVRLQGIG
jgi:hypothetical protein